MKLSNRILATLGIGSYILSVLASVENLEGEYIAPIALGLVSGIANLMFIVFATIRLWQNVWILAILLSASKGVDLALSILIAVEPSYGSQIIVVTNLVKLVGLVTFFSAIFHLFKMKNVYK